MAAMFLGLLIGLLASLGCGVRPENTEAPKATADTWMVPADGKITAGLAKDLGAYFYAGKTLPAKEVNALLEIAGKKLQGKQRLVRVDLSEENGYINVIGDIHGQLYDFLYIFELKGEPNETNAYLFNGDLVDRGEYSVEVVLTLLAWQLAFPGSVHVNRGNHEYGSTNSGYGFLDEVYQKYGDQGDDIYKEFNRIFSYFPLVHVIADQVFVTHGGLPPGTLHLTEINKMVKSDPQQCLTEEEQGLVWSDPGSQHGLWRSKRGAGCVFGPDVTWQFLQKNKLNLVIRSHEWQQNGIKYNQMVELGGQKRRPILMTVFSAPNYYGEQDPNLGGIVTVFNEKGHLDVKTTTFGKAPYQGISKHAAE